MNEPDWKALEDRQWTPTGDLCDRLAELPCENLYDPLLVIGNRLGVVAIEDLEAYLLSSHGEPYSETAAPALRLY